MTEPPLVVRKAIAAFSAESLLRRPWSEMIAFLVSIEEILIPDAEKELTVTHWLALAEQARDEGDLELVKRFCHEAGNILFELQEFSLDNLSHRLGATSLFRLEQSLFNVDEKPFEESLRRMQTFVDAFTDPLPSVEEIKRGITPKGARVPFDPISFTREARELALLGDYSRARKCLGIIDHGFTNLIDVAVANNWQMPHPFGAIFNR